MADSALTRKLQIKPRQRLLLLNAPPGFAEQLQPLPEGVELADRGDGEFDFVQLFVKNGEELNRFVSTAIQQVKHDGLLWICYPKGSSKVQTDLNRDLLSEMVEQFGWKSVSLVSLGNVWSAMRFRPADRVGK